MNKCFSFLRRHKKGLVVTVVVVAIVAGAAMRVLPSSGDEMRQSAVVVERRSCWEITAGNKAQLWLATADSDTTASQHLSLATRCRERNPCWRLLDEPLACRAVMPGTCGDGAATSDASKHREAELDEPTGAWSFGEGATRHQRLVAMGTFGRLGAAILRFACMACKTWATSRLPLSPPR